MKRVDDDRHSDTAVATGQEARGTHGDAPASGLLDIARRLDAIEQRVGAASSPWSGASPSAHAELIDLRRLQYGLGLCLGGLTLVAVVLGIGMWHWQTHPTDVTAVVGVFGSLVGTVVGAFFGVQVGAAGKGKAEALCRHMALAIKPTQRVVALPQSR